MADEEILKLEKIVGLKNVLILQQGQEVTNLIILGNNVQNLTRFLLLSFFLEWNCSLENFVSLLHKEHPKPGEN